MNSNSNTPGADSRQAPDRCNSNQFQWMRQVAFDGELPPVASRVAIALTKYFSKKHGGWSWVSQDTLAIDLGISVRTIRDAVAALVDRGHLISKRRGREETNLYHIAIKESDRQDSAGHDRQETAGHHPPVTGKFTSSDRQNCVKVTGRILPPNPIKEPNEEPNYKKESLPLDLVVEDSGRRQSDNEVFEAFWKAYPKRVAPTAALKAYRGVLTKKLATVEQLLAGALRYAAERSGQDPKFTKHPATWLNGGCWSDETAPIGNGPPIQRSPGGGYDHIAMGAEIARQIMDEEAHDGR